MYMVKRCFQHILTGYQTTKRNYWGVYALCHWWPLQHFRINQLGERPGVKEHILITRILCECIGYNVSNKLECLYQKRLRFEYRRRTNATYDKGIIGCFPHQNHITSPVHICNILAKQIQVHGQIRSKTNLDSRQWTMSKVNVIAQFLLIQLFVRSGPW